MSITWQDARDDSEWRSGWIAVAWTLALAIGEALGKRWGWISRRNDKENTGSVRRPPRLGAGAGRIRHRSVDIVPARPAERLWHRGPAAGGRGGKVEGVVVAGEQT